MSVKTKMAGLIVGLMVLSVPMVYAENGGTQCNLHHGGHGRMLAKVLGLSDGQVNQLKDLWSKQRDAKKAVFEQIKSNREAFEAEIVKASPDMRKINDLQNQLKTIQAQMTDDHLSQLLAIKKIMTPEQFAGFMALKKEKQLKMMQRMHGRFDHHDGWGKGGDDHEPGQDGGHFDGDND